MKKIILIGLTVCLATGCMLPQAPTHSMQTQFNEKEFDPYAKSGNCIIQGQAFVKTRGGDVKFGAGDTVYLTPLNSYTEEIFDAVTIHGNKLSGVDPRFQKYVRTTIADGNGNFQFTNVPSGKYLIECAINWEVPGQYGPYNTGADAYTRLTVEDGQTAKAIVTR